MSANLFLNPYFPTDGSDDGNPSTFNRGDQYDPFNIMHHHFDTNTPFSRDTNISPRSHPTTKPVMSLLGSAEDSDIEDLKIQNSRLSDEENNSGEHPDEITSYTETLTYNRELSKKVNTYLEQLKRWGTDVLKLSEKELVEAVGTLERFLVYLKSDFSDADVDTETPQDKIINDAISKVSIKPVLFKSDFPDKDIYQVSMGDGVLISLTNFKKSDVFPDKYFTFNIDKFIPSDTDTGYTTKTGYTFTTIPKENSNTEIEVIFASLLSKSVDGNYRNIDLNKLGEEAIKSFDLDSIEQELSVAEMCDILPHFYDYYREKIIAALKERLGDSTQLIPLSEFDALVKQFMKDHEGNLYKYSRGVKTSPENTKFNGVLLEINPQTFIEFSTEGNNNYMTLLYYRADGTNIRLNLDTLEPEMIKPKDGLYISNLQYAYITSDRRGNKISTMYELNLYTDELPSKLQLKEQGSEES